MTNWFYFFANMGVMLILGIGCYLMGMSTGIRQAIRCVSRSLEFREAIQNPQISCMVCKNKRPWNKIDVISHDVSGYKGFEQSGMCTINVKYCNDQLHCFEVAHVLDKWKDWPK
jgi:hypothetical protein